MYVHVFDGSLETFDVSQTMNNKDFGDSPDLLTFHFVYSYDQIHHFQNVFLFLTPEQWCTIRISFISLVCLYIQAIQQFCHALNVFTQG